MGLQQRVRVVKGKKRKMKRTQGKTRSKNELAPLAVPAHTVSFVSLQVPPEYLPPGLLTAKTTVLRI